MPRPQCRVLSSPPRLVPMKQRWQQQWQRPPERLLEWRSQQDQGMRKRRRAAVLRRRPTALRECEPWGGRPTSCTGTGSQTPGTCLAWRTTPPDGTHGLRGGRCGTTSTSLRTGVHYGSSGWSSPGRTHASHHVSTQTAAGAPAHHARLGRRRHRLSRQRRMMRLPQHPHPRHRPCWPSRRSCATMWRGGAAAAAASSAASCGRTGGTD